MDAGYGPAWGRMRAAVCVIVCTLALDAHPGDLMSLYRSALAYDAQYRAASASLKAGREALPQARAGLLPTLSAQVSSQQTDLNSQRLLQGLEPEKRSYNADSTTVTLTQPVFRWAAWQTYRIGELQLLLAEAQFAQAESDLIVRLSQAFLDVALALENHRLSQVQKTAASEKMALTRRNFEAGLATIVDFREAKARFDVISAAEIAAANDVAVKRLALRQITGSTEPVAATLGAALRLVPLEPQDQEFWVQQALAANPSVRANEASVAIALRSIEVNRAGHLPTLDLSVSAVESKDSGTLVSAVGTTYRYSQVAATLSIPIFSGGGVTSKVRQAAYQYEEALANLDRARREASDKAAEAFLTHVNGVAQTAALEEAVLSGQAAVAASKRGVDVGLRLTLDVLDAEQQLHQSRRDLVRARVDTAMARLKLRAAAGRLGLDDVKRLNDLLMARD